MAEAERGDSSRASAGRGGAAQGGAARADATQGGAAGAGGERARRRFEMPTSYSILLLILVAVALITLVVSLFVPEVRAATVSDVVMAPVEGFADAVGICAFVLVLGGFLALVERSGALGSAISSIVGAMGGNELALIPIVMFIFSILGTSFGFCEETVPFYALLAATMMAAGCDVLVGAAVVLLGAGSGTLGSTVNPFANGVAIDTLTSLGIEVDQAVVIGLGVVLWLTTYAVSALFVYRYAKRVKADRGASLLTPREAAEAEAEYGVGAEAGASLTVEPLTGRQKGVLAIFGVAFAVMIVGFVPWSDLGLDFFSWGESTVESTVSISGDEIASQWADAGAEGQLTFATEPDAEVTVEVTSPLGWSAYLTGTPLGTWYFGEATAWFFLMALLCGWVAGFSEREVVDTFIGGAASMMGVVLVIGLARGVSAIMQATGLSTWILEGAAASLRGVSGAVFAPLAYLVYVGLSFFIPSTSGMAAVSMPIMGPLAAGLGFSPAVMVQIYVAASGIVNLVTPTCAAIMGGLALAKVEWSTWARFCLKLLAIIFVMNIAILTVACMLVGA